MLIIIAQIIQAIQMVVEEKFVSGQNIPPLQAVGWEGKYFHDGVLFYVTEIFCFRFIWFSRNWFSTDTILLHQSWTPINCKRW